MKTPLLRPEELEFLLKISSDEIDGNKKD